MELSIIPNFIIYGFTSDDRARINLNILFSNILLVSIVFNFEIIYPEIDGLYHICLFQHLLGIPCPGCGLTRSFAAIANLELYKSLQMNPSGLLIFSFVLFQIAARISALLFEKTDNIVWKISGYINKLIISSLILIWIIRLIN